MHKTIKDWTAGHNYIYWLSIISFCQLLALTSYAGITQLPIQREEQKCPEDEKCGWCWAASATALLNRHLAIYPSYPENTDTGQCGLVNWYTERTDCCTTIPIAAACKTGFKGPVEHFSEWQDKWEDLFYDFFGPFGAEAVPISGYLSINSSWTEISNGRAYLILWAWSGGGGHYVVGIGQKNDGDKDYIYIMDVNPGVVEGGFIYDRYAWVVQGDYGPGEPQHNWDYTVKIDTSPSSDVFLRHYDPWPPDTENAGVTEHKASYEYHSDGYIQMDNFVIRSGNTLFEAANWVKLTTGTTIYNGAQVTIRTE